jgi:uracil-DNA glycosylase
LRAYLEVQEDTGAWGIPRGGAKSSTIANAPTAIATAPVPTTSPMSTRRTLEVVQSEVAACTKCQLSRTRNKTVFSRGNAKARLCIIGEGPGADEDERGLPFVGRAGELLDKMIAAMGLTENDVYICNIVKCRPPGNRTPEPQEVAACIPYLHEQLETVAPKVIVAMGNTAVGSLLGTSIGISRLRGEWKLYKGKTLVMPTYHPSFLLRESPTQQQNKREAWEDLQKVMKELGLTKRA